MLRKFSNSRDLFFLFVLGLLTRFFSLSRPSKVVFDETHFGLYATKYLSHQYYFDIHPPLGKMLLAFSGFLSGIKPGFDFAVSSPYADFNFLALRFLPALFGSFLILIIYLLVKEIGFSRRVAFLSAFLVLFDNAFVVQSRFILLDIILLFFIFLSFYVFFLTKRFSSFSLKWYLFYILTGLSLGAAVSIKWIGFGAMGVILFLSFIESIFSKSKKEIFARLSFIFLFPLIIYFLITISHLYLLPLPCYQNCGAVLDQYLENFRSLKEYETLEVFAAQPPGNIFIKFIELQKLMLFTNFGSGAHHYQSDWYSWPFMVRPIQYFKEIQNGTASYIYFFGNPAIWWLGIIGLLGYLYLTVKNYFYKFSLKLSQSFYSSGCEFLFLGYLIYLLPFASIERFMLMYHYLPALVFSIVLFAVFFEGVVKMIFGVLQEDRLFFSNKKANILLFGLLITVFLSFLYFSPLTYGFPLTENEFKLKMWLDTWSF